MSRRALLIGIDYHPTIEPTGSALDVEKIYNLFSREEDGRINFECQTLVAKDERTAVCTSHIEEAVTSLLEEGADVALFYFSGHGAQSSDGTCLVTSDTDRPEGGYRLQSLLNALSSSKVGHAFIILDCCHSGDFGNIPQITGTVVPEGVAVLAACSKSSVTYGSPSAGGTFTSILSDALSGGAADALGVVTIGSLYAFLDRSLGAWDPRPVFKAHLNRFVPLRQCEPAISTSILRALPTYFPTSNHVFTLDPSYEPAMSPRNERNENTLKIFQQLRDSRMLEPVDAHHLYFAAVDSKGCRLTPLGRHYWWLAKNEKI